MSWEIVSLPTGEPAVIPPSPGRHRGAGRSVSWLHRAKHRRGTPVVDLLPVPTAEFYQFEGAVAIPEWPTEVQSMVVVTR